MEFNKEEVIFIKTVLEDELMNLTLQLNKTENKKGFLYIMEERMDYLRILIKKIEKEYGDGIEI